MAEKKIKEKEHRAIIASIGVVVVMVILATLYSFFAILGKLPMTWGLFTVWLTVLTLSNSFMLILVGRHFKHLTLWMQTVIILWGGIAIWYWTLAPFYYYLSIELNQTQLSWLAFAYFWEVPVIGGGIFIGFIYLLFRDIRNFYDKKKSVSNPKKLFNKITNFPLLVGVSIVTVAVVGYAVGSLQLRWFAGSPIIEQLKGVYNGFVVSIFLGIFYYIVFDGLLNKVRLKFEKSYVDEYQIKNNLNKKVFWLVLFALMGGLGLISLLIFGSYQRVVADNASQLQQSNNNELKVLIEAFPQGQDPTKIIERYTVGEDGEVFVFESNKEFIKDQYSKETLTFLEENNEGIIFDRHNTLKLVSFFYSERHSSKIVSVVYLSELYSDVRSFSKELILGAIFVIILSMMVILLTSKGITDSIRNLAIAIKGKSVMEKPIHISTGDEIESLSHALLNFSNQEREISRTLEERVLEKTHDLECTLKKLEKQNLHLEKTKKAVINILEDLEIEKKKLIESERELVEAQRIGRFGTFHWDLQEKVSKWSDEAFKIHGLIPTKDNSAPKLRKYTSLVYKDDQDEAKRNIDESLKIEDEQEYIYRVQFKDKSIHWVRVSSKALFDKNGNPSIVRGTFQDITKEREIDKVKTEFVSLASHQLRTPLSSINWYSEMLLAGDAGKLTKDQKSYLEEIYTGNKRMVELVNALLNVSRLELGTFIVEPTDVDVVVVIQEVIKDLEPKIFERKMNVEEKYGEKSVILSLDKSLTRIFIENLISNAIKYTPEEGDVMVSLEKKENTILFTVKDNGFGIPEVQKEKIFGKLFRADNVKEKDTQGTGLGLYMVKSIVEYTGGRIWFESEENKGSTFYVEIPLTGMRAKTGSRKLD